MSTAEREYKASHPFIDFTMRMDKLSPRAWQLLGEAESKIELMAGVPLQPDVAQRLHEVYLAKGVHGTTSIENNTLSENEVLARIRGDLDLPPSRAYLGQEVDNIVEACNLILGDVRQGKTLEVTPARLHVFNGLVLKDLELKDGVVPGETRHHSVGVANYRAVPHQDVDYLLKELCNWLSGVDSEDDRYRFPIAVLRAIMVHLYLAWIHPYGDGNGRTARLMEFQLMVQAKCPIPAAHLLSDHYNRTREAYYRELDRAGRPPYDVNKFIEYALEGFVDELRDQIQLVQEQQLRVAWEHYVHSRFTRRETDTQRRQRHIVLDLGTREIAVKDLPDVSPRVARAYAGKQHKTVTRDVNALVMLNLLRRLPGGRVRANTDVMKAFMPLRIEG